MPLLRAPVLVFACLTTGLACALFGARPAAAQVPDQPYVAGGGRATIAGEVSAVAGPRDEEAFFNYTDYEHNALRTFRMRLLGEWRLHPRLALLGEVRTENADQIDAAALYARWRPWASRE